MKWYQEKSYKAVVWFCTITGIVFSLANTYYDGERFHWEPLALFGSMAAFTTIITYVLRPKERN